ncbi:MAG: hypothetical protein ACD_83C00072G0002 [uncultured bacterium]|nr:MAG: hypothetical protein ACD_83C00072G0002 [uncultured bacterium]
MTKNSPPPTSLLIQPSQEPQKLKKDRGQK